MRGMKKFLLVAGPALFWAMASIVLSSGYLQAQQKSVGNLLNDLVVRRDGTAVPALRDAFDRSEDRGQKQRIAWALLNFGEKDERYLNYLLQYAKPAVESDMPFPVTFDSQGRALRGQLSAEFLAWCKQKNIPPEVAAEQALHTLPQDLVPLTYAADPRAFDLLVQGLQSKNYMIVVVAARGLARLQDKRAIQPIIQASRRAPADIAGGIAVEALVFFDDPEAQAAVDEFLKDADQRELARKKAREKGVKGIFGF